MGADVLTRLPDLQVLAATRGSPTNVDVAAATARGLPVLATPARNAGSVADFCVGLLLALARGIGRGERHLREHGWTYDTPRGAELPYLHVRGPELAGRTLGVVGWGATGRGVARRLVDGFGMRLLVCDPVLAAAGSADVDLVGLDELLRGSDVVSLHVPRGPATDGLVGARELELLRDGAWLVNTSGGRVVDEAALVAALDAPGGPAGAALDVFAVEPLPRDSPLLGRDDVVLTPHLAGASDDVPAVHARMVLEDLAALAEGRPPRRCVNPEVLTGR